MPERFKLRDKESYPFVCSYSFASQVADRAFNDFKRGFKIHDFDSERFGAQTDAALEDSVSEVVASVRNNSDDTLNCHQPICAAYISLYKIILSGLESSRAFLEGKAFAAFKEDFLFDASREVRQKFQYIYSEDLFHEYFHCSNSYSYDQLYYDVLDAYDQQEAKCRNQGFDIYPEARDVFEAAALAVAIDEAGCFTL